MQVQRARTFQSMGILFKFHAFPADVMDKFCLVEAVVPPGRGAPLNHHAGETETFFMLSGALEFTIADEARIYGAGECIRVPDGAVHSFHAIGAEPARVLVLNAPGHMHEKFFTETGVAVDDSQTMPAPMDGPPDVARIFAVAAASGMVILPPA